MVMVVGDVAGVVVLDVPRLVRVRIPDREALAILVPRTLDLVRRCTHSPVETLRERAACRGLGRGCRLRLRSRRGGFTGRASGGHRAEEATRRHLRASATR